MHHAFGLVRREMNTFRTCCYIAQEDFETELGGRISVVRVGFVRGHHYPPGLFLEKMHSDSAVGMGLRASDRFVEQLDVLALERRSSDLGRDAGYRDQVRSRLIQPRQLVA